MKKAATKKPVVKKKAPLNRIKEVSVGAPEKEVIRRIMKECEYELRGAARDSREDTIISNHINRL